MGVQYDLNTLSKHTISRVQVQDTPDPGPFGNGIPRASKMSLLVCWSNQSQVLVSDYCSRSFSSPPPKAFRKASESLASSSTRRRAEDDLPGSGSDVGMYRITKKTCKRHTRRGPVVGKGINIRNSL
jgi:hypothetical protein